MKGILSGFLFGCFSLALASIIIGIIAPKPPESVNIKFPDGSEFINPTIYGGSNSEFLSEFSHSSYGITSPITSRHLNRDSSLENTTKLNPKQHNLNFSSILTINQKMQDGPLQPKIPIKNKDNSLRMSN